MEEGGQTGVELGRRRKVLSTMLVLVVVLSGAAILMTVGTQGARGATPTFRSLRLGIVNLQVTTMNPMRITLVDEYIVIFNTMSTLLTYDKSFNIVPDLAQSYSVSPNGTVWTLNLVHNAYFTNPTNPSDRSHPVTAADVVYSIELNRGYSASTWWVYTTPIIGATALDPYTVQLVTGTDVNGVLTPGPYAAMFSTLTGLPIMPEYYWSGVGNPINYKPAYPIGSGVMYYDSANSSLQSYFVLRRNPNYYGATDYCQFSRPTEIRFLSYTDPASMVADFASGTNNLNGLIGLDPTSYTSSTLAPFPRVAVDEGFVGEFAINVMPAYMRSLSQFKTGTNNPLLLDLTVRQAIAMSINKTALVADALLGQGSVADTLVPDTNPWHYTIPQSELYKFDPLAARANLNAAGWAYDSAGNPASSTTWPLYQKVGGSPANPLLFRFYTLNTEPTWQVAADDIVGWLHEAGIGTTDRLGNTVPGYGLYSINQMSGYWFSADYDMWLWDWVFSPVSDPSVDVMSVETTMAIGPTSDNFYSNQTFDSIYNQSLVTLDQTARRGLTNTLQSMVYDYASYILPYYQWALFAYRNDAPSGTGVAWTGWGDWNANVGMTPDSDLPNLWLAMYPANQQPPTISSFPAKNAYGSIAATLTATATDPENDIATYSWDFGDGSSTTTTTGSATHTYANPPAGQTATYNVSLTVSDGEWPVCSRTTVTVAHYVPGANQVPVGTLAVGPTKLYVNKSVWLNFSVDDFEGETVTVTWSFGDNSANVTKYGTNTTLVTTHTYGTAGNYTVRIRYTDNATPYQYSNKTITINAQPQQGGGGGGGSSGGGGGGGTLSNPWINYGVPIAIVAVVLIAVAAVMLQRRKKRKEDEQGTEAPKENPPPPR